MAGFGVDDKDSVEDGGILYWLRDGQLYKNLSDKRASRLLVW